MSTILLVEARFYPHLNDMLLSGARAAIEAAGHKHETLTVPGALEIPGAIALAARSGRFCAFAGLGVISTRAVVERWQQIGMLRALGYRRSLVQRSFLMESSLIAILGLLIGTLIGVWQSYRFFVVEKTFGTVIFHVPMVEISLILVGAYLATLVTTFLPARSASRVAPAEALRYE